MIINDVNSIMRWKTIPLPENFRLVNYIESSGASYARPAVIPDQNTRIVVDYMSLKTGTSFQVPVGCTDQASGAGGKGFFFYLSGANNAINAFVGRDYGVSLNTGFIPAYGERHIYDLSVNSIIIDGIDYGAPQGSQSRPLTSSVGYRFYLFARNQKDGNTPTALAQGRMYSFKVYQSGVLAYDYRPVVRNDELYPGFYNILLQGSGTPASSASGTPFTYG